jgi:glycosyltransferase involved in cell wall biosynthesis
MKIAVATIAYREARLLPKFLAHIPDWIDDTLVLVSSEPWNGEPLPDDGTAQIAEDLGADVIEYAWKNETEQRNTGQEYLSDCDWIIWLDPDEFLDNQGWENLRAFLEAEAFNCPAYITQHQRVFWKQSEVSPHSDYQQLIATRPSVRFVDNRVVDAWYKEAPVELYHFSWARTDDEVKQKISHYAHAGEFDGETWFNEVWLGDKAENLHPKTPETLKALVPAVLPPELEELDLWP